MKIPPIKPMSLIILAAGVLMLSACNPIFKESRRPNMISLTPRINTMFDNGKTICFGRFMVDVPESTTVVWGEANVPLAATIYIDGIDKVKTLAQEFIDKLKSEKAINHDNAPLLLSVDEVIQPEGKIVIGYEGFQAINGIKINGYFKLNNNAIVI